MSNARVLFNCGRLTRIYGFFETWLNFAEAIARLPDLFHSPQVFVR